MLLPENLILAEMWACERYFVFPSLLYMTKLKGKDHLFRVEQSMELQENF